jgi:hypothetical protein
VIDGPTRLLGRFAGHGDDRDDLLGAENGRLPGSGGIVKKGFQDPRQLAWCRFLFGTLEVSRHRDPAIPPEADRDACQAELTSHRVEARVGRQGEDDGGAANPTLIGRLLSLDALEQVLLRPRNLQSRRSWSSHCSTPEVNSLRIQWSIRSILCTYFPSG